MVRQRAPFGLIIRDGEEGYVTSMEIKKRQSAARGHLSQSYSGRARAEQYMARRIPLRRSSLGDGWHFLKASEVLDKKTEAPKKSISFAAAPLKGLKSYLGTYAFKGVGTQTADKLLAGAESDVFADLSLTARRACRTLRNFVEGCDGFCRGVGRH